MISSLMIAIWVHLYFDLWVEKIRLEEETAMHSSILAWKTPYTEEPGRLQSMRSQRVGQNWAWALTDRGYFENKGPRDSISKIIFYKICFDVIIFFSKWLSICPWFSIFCFVFFFSCSVISNSLCPHGLWTPRLPCPWDFPGKNTGVGCYFLLLGIFSTQGSNPCFQHWQADSLPLSHQGSPEKMRGLQMCFYVLGNY